MVSFHMRWWNMDTVFMQYCSFVNVYLVWTQQRLPFVLRASVMCSWNAAWEQDHFLFPVRLHVIFHHFSLYSHSHACALLSFCFDLFPASFTSVQLQTTPPTSLPFPFSLPSPSFLPSLPLCSLAAVMNWLIGFLFFSSCSTSPERVFNTDVGVTGASAWGERAEDEL